MMGTIFTKYLFENFGFLICTPLSAYLLHYIIEIWNDKDLSIIYNLNYEQKLKMINIIYDKDPNKYLDMMKCDNLKEKNLIEDYVTNIRKDIKYPKKLFKKANNYDEDTYKLIIKNIIEYNIKDKFDIYEKNMQNLEKKLKKSLLSKELKIIFENYYDIILKEMIDLEKFIDSQKAIFIKNYYELIYDIKKDNLKKLEVNYVVKKKILEFEEYVNTYEDYINLKYNTYINILTKWINIYNNGYSLLKINIYPSNDAFEEINIFQDICNSGERNLIKMISSIVNEMPKDDKNKILSKMSSGAKYDCEKYFIDEFEISKKMMDMSNNKDFIKKITFKPKNLKEFDMKIKSIADEINHIITSIK